MDSTIVVGQTASRTLTVTADHVAKFAEISGDYNPLHFDEAFALGMTVSRTDGEVVLEGSAWCYTMRPEPAMGAA